MVRLCEFAVAEGPDDAALSVAAPGAVAAPATFGSAADPAVVDGAALHEAAHGGAQGRVGRSLQCNGSAHTGCGAPDIGNVGAEVMQFDG
jgi:hypothetical protein